MNNCVFLGRLVDKPELADNYGTQVLRFKMSIDKYRKSKTGQKIRDRNHLVFEAWDSGARTISDHCENGDTLVVNCTARNNEGGVVFRVNEFKIMNSTQQTALDE